MPPKRKGAPGKNRGAPTDVKYANRLVIIKGPTIDVKLIMLVSDPCNSPCEFGGT